LQICRVEDLLVHGIVKGSVIHIHRARTIIIANDGLITASELGKEVILERSCKVFKASDYI
jgi:mannose/fructose/N-acetylgalactosamine-specific phosphotransferase system component IIB